MSKWWRQLAVVILSCLAIGQLSLVATATKHPASGGQGLEISPPVLELSASPGQTVEAKIKLRNVTKGALVISGKADDFGAKGEDGQPQILLDAKEATRYSLKFWVPQVSGMTLQPQEQRTITVPIVVPKNAEPGGHYGVIRFSGKPAELSGDESAVSLSASIGTLVLMRVSGDIKEGAQFLDFYASQGGKRGWFFESGPLNFTERLQNTGTVHLKPTGTLTVYGTFNRKIAEIPFNDPPHNVLPDSVRRFDQDFKNKALFGRYRVQLNMTYGASKTALTKTIVVWVIPWKLILFALLALIPLYFVVRQSIRDYNRRVIAKYKRRN